jgi:hypothetical protein
MYPQHNNKRRWEKKERLPSQMKKEKVTKSQLFLSLQKTSLKCDIELDFCK